MLQIYLTIIDDENEKSRFEELYERYARLMHYAAREMLADDRLAEEAVQEAFFRIARNFHKVGDVKSCRTYHQTDGSYNSGNRTKAWQSIGSRIRRGGDRCTFHGSSR